MPTTFDGHVWVAAAGAITGNLGFGPRAKFIVQAAGHCALGMSLKVRPCVCVEAQGIMNLGLTYPANVVTFAATLLFQAGITVGAAIERDGLTVATIVADLLTLYGVDRTCFAGPFHKARVIADLNSAMQTLWSRARARDYFTRATVRLSIPTGSATVDLPDAVQALAGPVRRVSDGISLRTIRTRGEYDYYPRVFYGQVALSAGTPEAHFLEQTEQALPNNAQMTLRVQPAASAATELDCDVLLRCPRYTWSDVGAGTPVRIPHTYAESLLLPLARHKALSSPHFMKETSRQNIMDEYAEAKRMLVEFDTDDQPAKKEKEKEVARAA